MFKFWKKKQTPEERRDMLYTEGMTLITNGYWISAFNVMKQATDMGHRGAMGQLAMMYIFGQGCEMDRKTGLELLQKSVELGNIYSCYAFSVLYDHGIDEVTADEAKNMCMKAAKAGMPEAINRLEKGFDKGDLYESSDS